MNNIAIIGIGNYLMGDEGVGIHAVEELRKHPWPKGVEVIDGGTVGIGLLHLIEGRDFVVIIDCADFGGEPGDIRVFDPKNLQHEEKKEAGLHAVDLLTALDLAKKTSKSPRKISIIGIQPEKISLGKTLSPEVQKSVESLREIVLKCVLDRLAVHPLESRPT